MWVTFFLSYVLPLNSFGLAPRTASGLIGIATMPFLHGSLNHLINNSVAFVLLTFLWSVLEGDKMLLKLVWIILIGGLLTWIFAGSGLHIGASGLIYGMFGYLLLSGIFSKQLKYLIVSVFLAIYYSSMVFGVLPVRSGISWEGHLSGFISGILVSWMVHKKHSSGRD
jgi:membrane associated rhomboid family serine protease